MSISRNELKYQLGLGKVSDITNVRKGLGQREWQNSQLSEIDVAEVREYYRLVREEMLSPSDALIQIACDRNGYSQNCDEIDQSAIDHSEHRDSEEEVSSMVIAARLYLHQGEIFKVVNLCSALPYPNTGFLTLKEHSTGIRLADESGHFAIAEAASLGIHICSKCYIVYGKIIAECECKVK